MRKPAPGHLTGTIEMAGGQPDRAVMVGDSEVDFATAAAAGVPAIGVTFGYTPLPVRELAPSLASAPSSITIASSCLRSSRSWLASDSGQPRRSHQP